MMIFTVPDPHNSHNPPLAEGTLEQVARLLEPGQYRALADFTEPVTINIAAHINVTAWVDRAEPGRPPWPTEDLCAQYSVQRSAW